MKTLNDFTDISPNMRWKDAAITQLARFEGFCAGMSLPCDIVGTHCSKSIELPVIRINGPTSSFYLRDNFQDINICVVAKNAINLPFTALFDGILEPFSWDYYLESIQKCRGYSWKSWTDEEMNDPILLRPTRDVPAYVTTTAEKKLRWCGRMSDPEWYSRDWSSGKICHDGEFGPNAKLWIQGHPFMQGISEHVPDSASEPYRPGCKNFALALDDLTQAGALIRRLMENVK